MQEEGYVNNVHNENNSEIQGSWIPGTPIKPSVVNGKPPICNELRQVNWSVNEGPQSGFPRELEFHGSVEYTSSNFLERGMGIHSWKPAFAGCAAGLSTFSFTEQLAFADASSSGSNGVKLGAVNGHLFPGFDPQSSSASLLPASPILQLGTKGFSPQNNCTEGIPPGMGEATYWHSCDLNSLPSTAVDTVSSGNVSITPATPDMSRRMDDKGASEVPNVCVDGHLIIQETNKENEIATIGVDVNEVNCAKEIDLSQLTQLEDHNPDKGGNGNIDLNKMPQLKQRKKKHRPKVITESKPRKRRTSKPATSNPTKSKEIPRAKRKYVRRKGLKNASTTPPPKETEGAFDLKNAESNIKSCRRALNFDKEGPGRGDSSSGRLNYMLNSALQAPNLCMRSSPGKSTVPTSPRIESMVENSEGGIVYDLEFSMNGVLKNYLSLPEKQGASIAPNKNEGRKKKQKADAQDVRCFGGRAHATTCEKLASMSQVMLRTSDQTTRSPNYCTHSTSVGFSEVEGARRLGKGNLENIEQAEFTALNLIGAYHNSFRVHHTGFHTNECKRFAGLQFPEMYMEKKKTEKVTVSTTSGMEASVASDEMTAKFTASCHQNESKASSSTSKENCWISTSQLNTNGGLPFCAKDTLGKIPVFHCIPASGQPERSTKKRTRGQAWFSEFASIGGCVDFMQPSFSATQAPSIEDLVAESRAMLAVKMPRKRGRPIGNSTEGSMDKMLKQLKHLNINSQMKKFTDQEQQALVPYKMGNQESNALVLYGRDGTVVPFNGPFDAIRKRRARPKVDLDEETSRVWNLLLGNINSEGIDGTDEEKSKWWEDERSVFRGRANSFVARMRLVQGDRRFSKWKGSVVDSVVGVFLTQNVSDHLSSSAFMSLAARFPLKSKGSCGPCHENTCIRVEDSEDTIDWNEKLLNQPVCDGSSVTLYNAGSNEDKEVVNSNESFGSSSGGFSLLDSSKCKLYSCESSPDTDAKSLFHASSCNLMIEPNTSLLGGKKLMDDANLSQSYVLSSQNSTDSSIVLTAERLGSTSESNSEVGELTTRSKKGNFNGPNSPVDLLQMEGATMSGVTSDYAHNHSDCLHNDQEGHDIKSDSCNNLNGVSVNPSSNYQLHLTSNSEILEVGFLKMLEEGQSYDSFKSVSEPSQLTTESTSLATVQNDLTVTVKEAPRSSLRNDHLCGSPAEGSKVILPDSKQSGDSASVIESLAPEQNEKMSQYNILRNFSVGALGGTRSPSQLKNQNIPENRRDESNIKEHNASSNKEFAVMKSNTSNEKRGRVPKQQEKAYNWDILRKEAQANGKKRGRTINTMDSLDWDAVRSADVGEIANTIKARGMNNMLAERIKAFLNRLHGEHGSIDLEWLRDVPPDKAKEYLLSIRGLGLKSVECVRLLTLHHLAFPVDTNVGRIAVRLGWVPLQPLPESLQLHLLELYPILESIQKYLWPRLCKLDQETLYELHYHMITFGKVFCTKGKPNCNACPLRGECRHFASAFASARLALPGPEEKNLVVRSESTAEYDGSSEIMNPLPLPLPLLQANQPLSLPQPGQLAEAISENVCEPIIEEPASPEPECTQKSESDIEDAFYEDPDEIPTIKLNIEEFTQNLQSYMQNNMELQEGEMSKALVALTPEVASLPTPKLKNVSRLRTEHQVYELPDSHQLLEGLDIREPDDPCSYLLAIWTPGETANSIQCPEQKCNSQESGKLCEDTTCLLCNSIREENSQTVRGTILIPCRTAMRGSFPLNGTYFQVNEVFADHHSSLNPIDVPRSLIWNLPRRTVYFGTSVPTIFKGLSTESIQHCFWRGYVCVRGFDQKTRAPRPLMARLHFPASKLKQKDQR